MLKRVRRLLTRKGVTQPRSVTRPANDVTRPANDVTRRLVRLEFIDDQGVSVQVGNELLSVDVYATHKHWYAGLRPVPSEHHRDSIVYLETVREAVRFLERAKRGLQMLHAGRWTSCSSSAVSGTVTGVEWSNKTGRSRARKSDVTSILDSVTLAIDHFRDLISRNQTNAYRLPNSPFAANQVWRQPTKRLKRAPRVLASRPDSVGANFSESVAVDRGPSFLGKGGYGEVRKATVTPDLIQDFTAFSDSWPSVPKLKVGQVVAIKRQMIGSASMLEKAVAETRFQASLQTTGLAPKVYASGYWASSNSQGQYFTAMEYLDGVTLRAHLKRAKTLDAALFAKIEDAVVRLWMAGIAHADLNPCNILIIGGKDVKIIDFGFATMLPRELVPKTKTEAYSEAYQEKMMDFLDGMHQDHARYVPDPHGLRWSHAHVPLNNRKHVKAHRIK